MAALRTLLIGSLTLVACEDELAHDTEEAAERVTKASRHLRHERRELATEVAERADDRAAGRDLTQHVGDIANEVADVNREAARLAQAQEDYANLKALRIASLRAEHSVAASQPLLIQAIARVKPLSPVRRTRLAENLAIFQQRLAETRAEIEDLQFVPAPEWEHRDDELGRAMAGLFLARDASWLMLHDHQRDEAFPET